MDADPPPTDLVTTIRRSVIGSDAVLEGPYGPTPLVYADYTASGRSLTLVEDLLRQHVLPHYANTHTESSLTGRHTTRLREEARAMVARAVGADERHAVVFTGTGSTGAIDTFLRVLGLAASDRWGTVQVQDPRPLVLIGPYEHHSNELPWRESIADVVVIDEDADGSVDLSHLETVLEDVADRPLVIGSFSAASNVTGILTDVQAVARTLHAHGALACIDYAAAAPYVPIEVSPEGGEVLDAVFISTHKYVGGPGTPGLLVARRELFDNPVPHVPGGGTVAYVSADEHTYLTDIEHREEGGTPDIVGAIRAGLVLGLKDTIGQQRIRRLEADLARTALARLSAHPAISVLGNRERERLSIISFTVDADQGRLLHHNLVVALLNDVFGVQARGGCSCAGPYGHRLLHIDHDHSLAFRDQIAAHCEGIKPGWTRVNLNYFLDGLEVDYILSAVELVAEHGHRLIDDYDFDPATGLWRHHLSPTADATPGLADLLHTALTSSPTAPPPSTPADLATALAHGRQVLLTGATRSLPTTDDLPSFGGLRWFPLPGEVCGTS